MASEPPFSLGICSDTHGGALPRWPGAPLSAVLHGGDVYDAPTLIEDDDEPAPRGWVEALGVPVLTVRGNHDFRDPGRFFSTAEDISGRLRRLSSGIWAAGVGFAPRRYYDVPGESDLAPQCRDLRRQIISQVGRGEKLILLTHYPPKLPELPCGQIPAGWTYQCIGELVDELQPIAVVQGHLHEWFGQQWRRNGSLIVSPGPRGSILSISSGLQGAVTASVSAE